MIYPLLVFLAQHSSSFLSWAHTRKHGYTRLVTTRDDAASTSPGLGLLRFRLYTSLQPYRHTRPSMTGPSPFIKSATLDLNSSTHHYFIRHDIDHLFLHLSDIMSHISCSRTAGPHYAHVIVQTRKHPSRSAHIVDHKDQVPDSPLYSLLPQLPFARHRLF